MELRNKKVLVVGFERTGRAACDFLLANGALVRVTEKKPAEALGDATRSLSERGVEFECGGHTAASFAWPDLIVPSPGVPPLPLLLEARARGVPVMSEIELAGRFLKGRVVAVTGSNGKSTTVTLTYRILKRAGLRARLAGNIGPPLISFVARSRDDDIYVTEVSSFQLEYTERFTAAAAAFLNISPNHIDWHGTFERYFEAKRRLFSRLGPESVVVLNRDDRLVWSLAKESRGRVFGFSRRLKPRPGAAIEDGWLVVSDGGREKLLKTASVRLPGAHNLENIMAAVLLARAFGAPTAAVRRAVAEFPGLEHRLERVATVRGVLFVNDSKATTVDATFKALASFDRPVILILGGRDKGSDFTTLRPHLRRKVRSVVLVGEAADKIERAVGDAVPCLRAGNYREVVRTAFGLARPGDVVLLAPACTSWDMFRNFEERGRTFKREVRLLARGAAAGRRRMR
jgi:UDP-N-acetylmuramoylalanine--D-glutamate ligase